MIYTCPKCGKKMDLSTEMLIDSGYKVVCPQCLSELKIVGDYAYVPHDSLDLNATVEPSHDVTCPYCGQAANSNAHFCPNCGSSFDATPVTPTPQQMAIDIAPEEAEVLPPPMPDVDPLYNEALQFLTTCTSITPMMLRDRFHISNERAAELIRQLEAGGAVGPYNNGGPRQILIPHSGAYWGAPNSQGTAPMGQGDPNQQPRQRQQRRGGFGCVTWFIIIMFIIMMMRACS